MRFHDTLGISHFVRMLDLEIEVAISRELQKYGLSHAQYSALSALEQTPGLSNAELARTCFVTPQTMNRMIIGLEKSGLVSRHDRKGESLCIDLKLTKRAQTLICEAHVAVDRLEKQMCGDLSREQLEDFKAQLLKWKNNISAKTR